MGKQGRFDSKVTPAGIRRSSGPSSISRQEAWEKAKSLAPQFWRQWGLKKITRRVPYRMSEYAYRPIHRSRWIGPVYERLCYMAEHSNEVVINRSKVLPQTVSYKTVARALDDLEHDWRWIVTYAAHYGRGRGQKIGVILLHKVRP